MEKTLKYLAFLAQQGERRVITHYFVVYRKIKNKIFFFLVRCLKAMQCVFTAWKISELPSMVLLPTERDQSITGHLTKTKSPTLDLDL